MTGSAPASVCGELVLAAANSGGAFVSSTAMSAPAASLWRHVAAGVWLLDRPERAGVARVPSPAR